MEKKTSEKITWTTWEELLISCAVKRHGVNDWNAVSTEIQSRTTSLPHVFTTPRHCKLKYLDLKRRFKLSDDVSTIAAVKGVDGGGEDVPWIDELKDLRLAELRQEVLNYDSSILSLQLKVKRLEEEREQSVKSNDEKPDLENFTEEHGSENAKHERDERHGESPEILAEKSVSDEKSDRENQSANESDSTDKKLGIQITADKVFEPEKSGSDKLNPFQSLSSPVCDESCNASSDSIAKDLTKKTEWDSSELRDSVSESMKNMEENTKDSNDEQSSASLMRSSSRKYETECAAIKNSLVKSQPLIGVLELIRSHNYGSLFESRQLESQESDKYNNIVRQHMDLQTVQKKLQEGSYSSSPSKFYRDLLLIFNNAIVFFSKSSVESAVAVDLRNLVVNAMSKQTQSSNSSPAASLSPVQNLSKPKLERPEQPLLAHQKLSAPIIVCRKRSSISSKAASAAVVYSRKNELKSEVKISIFDSNPQSVKPTSSLLAEEKGLMKSDTKENLVTGKKSFRKSNISNLKNSDADRKETTEKINNKKEKEKKSSAANFLKRIKENSPLAKSKSPANNNGDHSGDARGDNKRKFVEKKDGRINDIVLRPKPIKKNADLVPVKRRREAEASTSKRPKKRSRR